MPPESPPHESLHPSLEIARGRRIREVMRLVQTYGGQASRWSKRKGPRQVVDGVTYEYHWYEHHGLGRVEFKLKRISP